MRVWRVANGKALGAREFILTAHVVPVITTTRHSPAERRERESGVRNFINHATVHPLSLPDSRSQVLSRTTTNFAAKREKNRAEMLFTRSKKCHANAHPKKKKRGAARILQKNANANAHEKKNGALRALPSVKRKTSQYLGFLPVWSRSWSQLRLGFNEPSRKAEVAEQTPQSARVDLGLSF
jgi:hypothetical protein